MECCKKYLITIWLCSLLGFVSCDVEAEEIAEVPGFFIFNGKQATNYSYHVGLIENVDKTVFCSGSLISTQAVLTAAHCLRNVTKDDFQVVVGEFDLSVSGDEQAYHKIKQIIIHEDFNPSNYEYDFGIILLDEPVKISSMVTLVALPPADTKELAEKTGFVNGWGLNENLQLSTQLQQVEMEFISNLVCQYFFNHKRVHIDLTRNHICAVSKEEESRTCNGDSGGGLIYEDEGKHYIIGVLSGSKQGCQPQFPTFFANVITNLDWITENMIPKEKQPIDPDCVANRFTKVVDVPCQFPFIHDGTTHNSCPYDEGKAWCATAVDKDGIIKGDHWGYCSKECPKNQQLHQSPPVPGCSTPIYKKGDGFPACAIILEGTFDFIEAEAECTKRGGKLPEIYSEEENDIIAKYRDQIENGIGKIAIGRIEENTWKFTNFKLTYNNFDDKYLKTECFVLSSDGNKWVGADCSERMNVICEKLIYNSKKSKSCKTTSGPKVDNPCIFPFKFKGNVFHGCTSFGSNKPWCMTQVSDSKGSGFIDEWGFCGEECPMEEKSTLDPEQQCKTVSGEKPGLPCVFPFVYDGITYDRCTLDAENYPWCSTQVDSNGGYISPLEGFCHKDCPSDSFPDDLSYTKSDGSVVSLIPVPFAMVFSDATTQCESMDARVPTFDNEDDFNEFQKSVGRLKTYISKIIMTENGKLVWKTSGKRLTFSKFKNSEDEESVNEDSCIHSLNGSWTIVDCFENRNILCEKVIH